MYKKALIFGQNKADYLFKIEVFVQNEEKLLRNIKKDGSIKSSKNLMRKRYKKRKTRGKKL